MCGLVGIIRLHKHGLLQLDKQIFDDLLIADSVRGSDGTGLISVLSNGNRLCLKVEGNPFNLMRTKTYEEYTDVTKVPYPMLFAGHNRYATTGGVSTKTAHPFYHGDVSMMHNGTLRKYDAFPGKFDVDSESLCNAINKSGIDWAISNMQGAYALAFYNKKEKTFNLARNYERPLWIAESKKDNVFIWASEKAMIEWVLDRRKKNLHEFEFSELPVNTLMSFNIKDLTVSRRDLPHTGSKLAAETKHKPTGYGGYWEGESDYWDKKKKKEQSTKVITTEDKSNSFLVGAKINFFLDDHEDIHGNAVDTPKNELRYSITGKRDDMKYVQFRGTVTGQSKLFDCYANEELTGVITSIYDTKDDKGTPLKRVWCTNIKCIGE